MNMNKQNKNTILFSIVLIVGLSIGAALFFDYWKENHAKTIDENYCNQYQPDSCPNGCVVCPPCPECSSIQCRLASSCEAMGFDTGKQNHLLMELRESPIQLQSIVRNKEESWKLEKILMVVNMEFVFLLMEASVRNGHFSEVNVEKIK